MSGDVTTVETALLPVSVRRTGDGPTVLYLHDFMFDVPTDEPESPRLQEALAGSVSLVAPVLPGFDDVTQLAPMEDVEDYVFLLLDTIAGLGLDRPHVVGAGFGGWLAAELAVRRSDLLQSVTLVNAFGLKVDDHPTARFFYAAAPDPLGGKHDVRHLLFAEPEGSLAQAVMPDQLAEPRATTFFRHVHAAARIGWEPPAFYDRKLRSRLSRITVPTQVIWGRANAIVDLAHAEAYAAGIEGAELTILDDAGHLVVYEKPKELAEIVVATVEGAS
jgi:pimeloyl-ACP methyl ester carboxylesterase